MAGCARSSRKRQNTVFQYLSDHRHAAHRREVKSLTTHPLGVDYRKSIGATDYLASPARVTTAGRSGALRPRQQLDAAFLPVPAVGAPEDDRRVAVDPRNPDDFATENAVMRLLGIVPNLLFSSWLRAHSGDRALTFV